VELDLPEGGTWYIGLFAVEAFEGLRLATRALDNSDGYWIQEQQLTGVRGSWKDYYLRVNREVSSLRIFLRCAQLPSFLALHSVSSPFFGCTLVVATFDPSIPLFFVQGSRGLQSLREPE
jgi:hypothetical protein